MTHRSQPVATEDAVRCRVLPPFVVFDIANQRQVGPGSLVDVHPGTVRSWVRNRWVKVAGDDPTEAEDDNEPAPAESVAKAPTAPRRRAAKKKPASG
uniref:hypothetical protein n=1 Tax=unclassified Rhodococcus (in: high G+C Gram-positive bacteria) TaxID=192944 RepID=UPI0011407E61|nr:MULTISPECIES: hypothetical protein [unclassified Rhodococcus (in: high G+C Gram-positive bacteria)]